MKRKKITKKTKILDTINQSEIELTPKEIALRTGLNRSTVKNYVRKLLEDGKILQPYYRTYASIITHGMMKRVHNFILTCKAPWLDFSDDVVKFFGDVKVRVQFGLQRHKITGRISCDVGMDKNTLIFALNWVHDLVKQRTGHGLVNPDVKTLEVNRDLKGLRIDPGKSCFTWKGLFGVIERIYQKEKDTVRVERKFTRKMNIGEATSLLEGPRDNVQEGLYLLSKKVDALVDAQKYQNLKITEGTQRLDVLENIFSKTVPSNLQKITTSFDESTRRIASSFERSMSEHLAIIKDFRNTMEIFREESIQRTEEIKKLLKRRKRKRKKKSKPPSLFKRIRKRLNLFH